MFPTQVARFQVHKSVQHMVVHVTNHCNLRCDHCFVDFSSGKRDLPLAVYQQLATDLGHVPWLDIGGGEPFSRPDLVDVVAAFDADVVTIPTNGWFVERVLEQTRILRDRLGGELTIALSLDGLEATHDRIRQRGSWARVWRTFEGLQAIDGVLVKFNTVVTRDNLDEIVPLMQHVQAREPAFHSVLIVRGDTLDDAVQVPTIAELRGLQGPMFEILARYTYGQGRMVRHVLRNYHRMLWETSLETLRTGRQVVPCLAGVSHGVVMGNGDVLPCEMLPAIGNLLDRPWPELWRSTAMERRRRSIAAGECACTHNCALLDSILLRPRSYPRLLTRVRLGEA